MSRDIIQFAFAAGEMSPKLFGRQDLEKYDFGLTKAKNWYVDHRGGLTTRAGQLFIDFVKNPSYNTKYFKFQYSPDSENTYVVLFAKDYVRFIQDGSYVVEAAKNIAGASKAGPGVVTANAHGYSNGDWIQLSGIGGMTELNNRTFEVAGVTVNTFTLIDPLTSTAVDTTNFTTYTSGGVARRIYTIVNPYADTDLDKLKAYQIRDYLRLTHPNYPVKNLIRTSATNWSISNEVLGNANARPAAPTVTASAAGSAGVVFAVTAVFPDGSESIQSNVTIATSIVNYTATAGFVTVTWAAVTGAVAYRIYRSLVLSAGANCHGAMQLGYVGQSYAPIFTDNNIVPDFSVSPPQHYNPFANGAIEFINITAGGSGYTSAPTVSVSGAPGSGFIGYSVINGGAVVAVIILHRGSGYVSPTVSFSGGGGSGATATASASDASGNNPTCSTLFQQRQLYAATQNNPLTVLGSRPGQLANFDTSPILNDGDSIEFELDASTVAPIRHMVVMRGGVLSMSQTGIWQLTGGSSGIITPTDALAEPQTYVGCADIVPLNIDTDLLYVTEKESTVRLLEYSDYTKLYGGKDMSLLSNHLFSASNRIVRWTYEESPNRHVHAVRQDGSILTFTIVKEQNVFAWTRFYTNGFYRDVLTVEEDGADVTYLMVERIVNGNVVKFIEQFAPREFADVEEAVCLDAALTLTPTFPAAACSVILDDTDPEAIVATITASSGIFSAGDVGKVFRGAGGKIIIDTYTSSTVISGVMVRPIVNYIPETEIVKPLLQNEWTLDTPITTISGLNHLEGATVSILADGSQLADKIVTNGRVVLENAATRVVIGLKYTCVAATLPPTAPDEIVEGHRKDIVGVAVRLNQSRGLAIGASERDIFDMKERSFEFYGQPTELRSGIYYETVDADWEADSLLYFVQRYPLPASILGIVKDLEVGDDNN